MSLYIIPENQKLIWDYIHKVPVFVSTWQNTVPGEKEKRFNQIISHFYESVKYKTLNVQDVRQLNRQTIMAILDDTKKMTSSSSLSTATYSSFPTIDNTVTQQYMLEHKQQELSSHFNDREKEYSLMLKGSAPPQIDFRLSEMDEGPIENMNALIEQHMKSRDTQFAMQPLATNTENIDSRIISDLVNSVQEMKQMIEKMQQEIRMLQNTETETEPTNKDIK